MFSTATIVIDQSYVSDFDRNPDFCRVVVAVPTTLSANDVSDCGRNPDFCRVVAVPTALSQISSAAPFVCVRSLYY
jgi:hypothetical protein